MDTTTTTAPTAGFTFDFDAGKKKLFPKGYNQQQVDWINAIVHQANLKGITIKAQLAYVLATPYHETYDYLKGIRFGAMTEMGGDAYLKAKSYYPFYGRGPSHLTWKANYEKEAKRTGLDLVNHPDLMLDVNNGSESHVYCMINGVYTGKKLSDYINATKTDFVGARYIINGQDQASLIAGYAESFMDCITNVAVVA
jgi:predicted chitinase